MEESMRGNELKFAIIPAAIIVAGVACGGSQEISRSGSNQAPEDDNSAVVEVAEASQCPDRDRDGVCDVDDHCLTQVGRPETLGCPIEPCSGTSLMAEIQFDFDSSELRPPQAENQAEVDPVLDAVGDAIAQDSMCRVCIIGHASVSGEAQYNLNLSRRRALGVQGYLVARGLPIDRLPMVGLGERCQITPIDTRAANRWVEFRRLQEGESCPVACSD
jgi:outer membrane protein OmpA-like peptidoglycan-associated protein